MKKLKNLYFSLPKQHQFIISGLTAVTADRFAIADQKEPLPVEQTDQSSLEVGKRYSLASAR